MRLSRAHRLLCLFEGRCQKPESTRIAQKLVLDTSFLPSPVPHFPDGVTGAQRGCVSCLRSQSQKAGTWTNSVLQIVVQGSICYKNSFKCFEFILNHSTFGSLVQANNFEYGKSYILNTFISQHKIYFSILHQTKCVTPWEKSINNNSMGSHAIIKNVLKYSNNINNTQIMVNKKTAGWKLIYKIVWL